MDEPTVNINPADPPPPDPNANSPANATAPTSEKRKAGWPKGKPRGPRKPRPEGAAPVPGAQSAPGDGAAPPPDPAAPADRYKTQRLQIGSYAPVIERFIQAGMLPVGNLFVREYTGVDLYAVRADIIYTDVDGSVKHRPGTGAEALARSLAEAIALYAPLDIADNPIVPAVTTAGMLAVAIASAAFVKMNAEAAKSAPKPPPDNDPIKVVDGHGEIVQ